MSVTRLSDREMIRCECCSVLDRKWVRIEIRKDGAVELDVKLCRRCASTVGSSVLAALTFRNTDPVAR